MTVKNTGIVIILFRSLTGCASVYQTKFSITDEERKHTTARPYYLPKGYVSFNSSIDEKGIATFEMLPKFVADTQKRLYLIRNHNEFYDDNFVVQTTIDGLLTSVNTKTTFKGLEIAQKIGELAGTAAQLAAFRVPAPVPECKPLKVPSVLNVEIDPANLEEANAKLKLFCFKVIPEHIPDNVKESNNLLLEMVKKEEEEKKVNSLQSKVNDKDNNDRIADGIAYRSTADIILSVEYTGLGQYQKKIFRVSVPDVANIFYAPVRRSFFVNRDHAYGFTTGVLTRSTVDHPSEVLDYYRSLSQFLMKFLKLLPEDLVQKQFP